MNLVLTGATGFIGTEFLRQALRPTSPFPVPKEIRVLARSPEKARIRLGPLFAGTQTQLRVFEWDSETAVAPATAFEGADAVLHLAGENVAGGRWTEERKTRILESRRAGTHNLVEAINSLATPPVFVSASATGYYGDRGNEPLTEASTMGDGFLAQVCQAWEEEARQARVSRLVVLRFGVVLEEGGGALEKLTPVFKAGLGGKVGDGTQWMAWIHRDDLVSLLLYALHSDMRGIYNGVAPEPVTNQIFTETLGRVLHRPTVFSVPAFALRLALGQMADETLLASQRVEMGRLAQATFTFQYPTLEEALRAIFR